MHVPDLIADPADVSAAWFTDVVRHATGVEGATVTSFEAEQIGTGQVGTNVRYSLSYRRDDPGLPRTLVAKFASRDPATQLAGVQTRTYETEVAFYRDLADTVDVTRPRCYFAAIEPGTANVVLVLEDIAPAVAGDQIAGCSLEQAGLAMVEAARLHGPRWGDPSLLEVQWLAETASGSASADGLPALYAMFWPIFLERYRDRLDPRAIPVGEHLGDSLSRWIARRQGVQTLTHADFRPDNMLFGTAGGGRPLTVVDWQTVRLGVGTADVSYFLGAGLDPELRRVSERSLVSRYHEGLVAYGVADYPFDACWEDYRRFSYGGFLMAVLASIFVGRTDRGDAMFMAMANRHVVQIEDLGAAELL